MKKILLIVLFPILLLAEDLQLKSVQVYSANDITSIPIVFNNGKSVSKFVVEFDAASAGTPDIIIKFRFCDRNWKPYKSNFFNVPGYDTENMLDFISLPPGNDGADWHCKKSFPNKNIKFPFSGKWIFEIVDGYDESKVYYTGRFYVVKSEIALKTNLSIDQLDGKPYSQNSLNRSLRLTSELILDDPEIDRFRIRELEVVENRRINDPIKITAGNDTDTRYHEWSLASGFRFIARDIRPGNENRRINMLNITKFGQYEVDAHYDGPEISYFFRKLPRDLNGGYKLKKYSDPYANYMDVKFQIKMPPLENKDLFLVGPFTDWKVLPDYKMEYVKDSYVTYEILKRGVYDYKYVSGIINGDKVEAVDWCEIDGNHLETENVYNLFLFYEDPDLGGYDKIIGYSKIYSGYYGEN